MSRLGLGLGMGFRRSQQRGFSGTLDDYPGSKLALSIQRLGQYNGPCVRVRRSSDNSEKDIRFSGGVLNESSLLSFVGASSGYVAKWYDQSGAGNDAVQTAASAQPQIVSSGTLVTEGGLPAIDFDGAAQFLGVPDFSYTRASLYRLLVLRPDTVTKEYSLFAHWDYGYGKRSHLAVFTVSGKMQVLASADGQYTNAKVQTSSESVTTDLQIVESQFHANAQTAYRNGVALTLSSDSDVVNEVYDSDLVLGIGADFGSGAVHSPFNGTMQEVLFFDMNQTSRAGLYSARAGFYGVS